MCPRRRPMRRPRPASRSRSMWRRRRPCSRSNKYIANAPNTLELRHIHMARTTGVSSVVLLAQMGQNLCHGTVRAVRFAGVKPEVDGTPPGSAVPSVAAISATELTAVLEELPSGVVIADKTGRTILTNRAARRLLGEFV